MKKEKGKKKRKKKGTGKEGKETMMNDDQRWGGALFPPSALRGQKVYASNDWISG
jgi:hypothetical protein